MIFRYLNIKIDGNLEFAAEQSLQIVTDRQLPRKSSETVLSKGTNVQCDPSGRDEARAPLFWVAGFRGNPSDKGKMAPPVWDKQGGKSAQCHVPVPIASPKPEP